MTDPSGAVSNALRTGLGKQRVGPSSPSQRLSGRIFLLCPCTVVLRAPAGAHHGRTRLEAWLKPANQTMTLTLNIR